MSKAQSIMFSAERCELVIVFPLIIVQEETRAMLLYPRAIFVDL